MSKVLIIDDDSSYREKMRAVASEMGRFVVTAENGQQGLVKAREIVPALILLDVVMSGPGNDGYSCLAAIRRDPTLKNTAVVMVTTKSGPIDKKFAHQSGANDYLVKPFKTEDLKAVIAKFP